MKRVVFFLLVSFVENKKKKNMKRKKRKEKIIRTGVVDRVGEFSLASSESRFFFCLWTKVYFMPFENDNNEHSSFTFPRRVNGNFCFLTNNKKKKKRKEKKRKEKKRKEKKRKKKRKRKERKKKLLQVTLVSLYLKHILKHTPPPFPSLPPPNLPRRLQTQKENPTKQKKERKTFKKWWSYKKIEPSR